MRIGVPALFLQLADTEKYRVRSESRLWLHLSANGILSRHQPGSRFAFDDMVMVIRIATSDDARDIAAIHVRAWQVAYQGLIPDNYLQSLSIDEREHSWRKLLESNTVYAWIAEERHNALGWIVVGNSRDPDTTATTAELWAIYVNPDHWRQGVGRSLWQVARERCIAAPFSEITLWLFKDNHRAFRFYTALGFGADAGHEKKFVRGDFELAEIRLRCRLGDCGIIA